MKRYGEFIAAADFGHINEVAWPVLLNRGGRLTALGTAISIGRGVALTAAHYIDQLTGFRSSVQPVQGDFQMYVGAFEQARRHLLLSPVIHIYAVPWLDVAVLYLADAATPSEGFHQKSAHIDYGLPQIGTEVAVIGYRRATVTVTSESDGRVIHNFDPRPTTSLGHILEVHPRRRDAVTLNFPCFRTDAAFDDGMSGGPVFDNRTGRVIGLVCASFEQGDSTSPPISYASLLWPVLGTEVQMRRADLPEGSSYRLRELYEKKFMQATGWEPFWIEPLPDGEVNFNYGLAQP